MIIAVADTHVVIWYLFDYMRLSSTVSRLFIETAMMGNQIGVSSISLGEIVYLIEKGRIAAESFTSLINEIETTTSIFTEIPFDRHIARAMTRIDARQIPDLPDRMIAATGLSLNVPLISRDGLIRAANLHTIW